MTGPRAFILALILLGALYLAALGFGLSRSDEPDHKPFQPPGWVRGLADRFAGDVAPAVQRTSFDTDRLTPDGQFLVRPAFPCKAGIKGSDKSKEPVRQFRLTADPAARVQVWFQPPDYEETDPPTSRPVLGPDSPAHPDDRRAVQIFVGADGGTLTLTNLDPSRTAKLQLK